MAISMENLLRAFDQKRIVEWHPDMKNGEESYRGIIEAIHSEKLNAWQLRNALHAIFRLSCFHRKWGSETLDTLIGCSQDARLTVRSEAIQLIIGLVRLSAREPSKPLVFSPSQRRMLRTAMAAGASQKVVHLAERYFPVILSN